MVCDASSPQIWESLNFLVIPPLRFRFWWNQALQCVFAWRFSGSISVSTSFWRYFVKILFPARLQSDSARPKANLDYFHLAKFLWNGAFSTWFNKTYLVLLRMIVKIGCNLNKFVSNQTPWFWRHQKRICLGTFCYHGPNLFSLPGLKLVKLLAIPNDSI